MFYFNTRSFAHQPPLSEWVSDQNEASSDRVDKFIMNLNHIYRLELYATSPSTSCLVPETDLRFALTGFVKICKFWVPLFCKSLYFLGQSWLSEYVMVRGEPQDWRLHARKACLVVKR